MEFFNVNAFIKLEDLLNIITHFVAEKYKKIQQKPLFLTLFSVVKF